MATVTHATNVLEVSQGESLVLKFNFANKIRSADLTGTPTVVVSGPTDVTTDNETASGKKAQARFIATATARTGLRRVKFTTADDATPAQTVIGTGDLLVTQS
mgnify:CR=1 FL=1